MSTTTYERLELDPRVLGPIQEYWDELMYGQYPLPPNGQELLYDVAVYASEAGYVGEFPLTQVMAVLDATYPN